MSAGKTTPFERPDLGKWLEASNVCTSGTFSCSRRSTGRSGRPEDPVVYAEVDQEPTRSVLHSQVDGVVLDYLHPSMGIQPSSSGGR